MSFLARGVPWWARKLPAAAGASSPLDSLPFTDNLLAFYANNTGLTEQSSFISGWADQSGNGYDLTQTSSTRYPENNAGTITFDGVDDFLESDALALSQPYGVYFYGQQVTWVSNDRIWDVKPAGQGTLRQSGIEPWVSLYAGGGSGNHTNWTVGSDRALYCLFNGTSALIQLGSTGVSVGGNCGTLGGTGWTLGAILTQANACNVQIRELMIFTCTHTTAEYLQMLSYLEDKFA